MSIHTMLYKPQHINSILSFTSEASWAKCAYPSKISAYQL